MKSWDICCGRWYLLSANLLILIALETSEINHKKMASFFLRHLGIQVLTTWFRLIWLLPILNLLFDIFPGGRLTFFQNFSEWIYHKSTNNFSWKCSHCNCESCKSSESFNLVFALLLKGNKVVSMIALILCIMGMVKSFCDFIFAGAK